METANTPDIAKLRANLATAKRAYKLAEIDARAYRGLDGSGADDVLTEAARYVGSCLQALRLAKKSLTA